MPNGEDKIKQVHNLMMESYDDTPTDFAVFSENLKDPAVAEQVHAALTKQYDDIPDFDSFQTNLGLKKKESTKPRDFFTLGKMVGEGIAKRGEAMAQTRETKQEVQQENELLDLANQPATQVEEQPRHYDKDVGPIIEEPETYQEKLGIGTVPLEATREVDLGPSPEERQEAEDITQRLKLEEDRAIEEKAATTVEDAFTRAMQTEGRRGIPIEEGDIPKTIDELAVLEGARQNYNMELEMKMDKHLTDDMKAKAQLVQKERELWEVLKTDKQMVQSERMKIKNQLQEINKQLAEMDFNKKLFDPATGETVDKEEASQEAAEYALAVNAKQKEYESDIQKAYNIADRVVHRYELYNDQLDEIAGTHLGKQWTYRELLDQGRDTWLGGELTEDVHNRAWEIRDKWVDAKADAEAVSRAIMLNEDPAQIERGFGEEAGFWSSAAKGFMEGIGREEVVTSMAGDFPTKWAEVVQESGEQGLLTQAQMDNAQMTFTEKSGYGVGASIPVMGEIAITTIATEGIATEAVIAKRIKQFKDMFSGTKAGRLFANTLEQGVKGYVTFAPTSETGATGVGEGVAQGFLDTLIPEKLLGSKYGKLLNGIIRVAGGATGETIGEVSGQYFDALANNGYDARQAFTDAFGRTPEERWENLALIGTTSLLFSSAFNLPRLAMTQEALQAELDAGNVPEADQAAVKEIINEMGNKLESEGETPPVAAEPVEEVTEPVVEPEVTEEVVAEEEPIKTEEDAVQIEETTEIPVQPEAERGQEVQETLTEPELEEPTREVEVEEKEEEITEPVEPEAEEQVEGAPLRIEEPVAEQEARRVADVSEVEGEPEVVEEAEITEEPVEEVAEEPTGETITYTRVRSGKKEDVVYTGVDRKEVLFTDKRGNTLHKHSTGLLTLNKDGKPMSQKTTERMMKQYEDEYDFTQGKTVEPDPGMGAEEVDRMVAETSENPQQLADIINRRRPLQEEAIETLKLTKEGAIAEVMSQGSLNPDSFMRNTGLARKDIPSGIRLHYFRKGGKPLDILAMEAQDVSMGAASQVEDAQPIEITEQDIVDFVSKYPNTRQDFYKDQGVDPIVAEAESRFQELTGFKPTDRVINKAIGEQVTAEVEEEVTKESLMEDVKSLRKDQSTNELYQKAVDAGIDQDPEIQEAISEKAKAHKQWRKKMDAELGIDEDIDFDAFPQDDLPFQKGSRKNIAGKKYLSNVIKQLKKAAPGVKFEYDTTMDELGMINEAGNIVLNPNKATTDTAIHEVAHIWVKLMKAKNSNLYKTGITLVKKNQELMDYVSATRPDLKTEEAIAEEALVTAIGEDGADFFTTKEQRNALQRFLDKIADFIRRTFNIKRRVNWAEMTEMNLKDFTKMASQELLSETPFAKITDEDVQNIMSEELILNTVNIDSSILSDKGATLLDKGKDSLKGLVMSEGKLPKWVANLDNNTRAAVNAWISEASRDVHNFNQALDNHIENNNLDQKQIEQLMKDIDSALRGDKTSNLIALNNEGMTVDLITSITAMRNNIDQLSEILLEGGYLKGDILATISENMGSYITRSYEIHKEAPKTAQEWLNKMNKHTPEVVERAKEFIVEQYRLAKISKINFINKGDGRYDVTLENEFGHKSGKVQMTRGEIISVLQEGKLMIADEDFKMLDSDKDTITLNKSVNPEKYGIAFNIKDADVDKVVNDILSKHLKAEDAFGIAGLNKKDISILKRRKDIPKEIRDLLGEIKDPAANYIETVSKMASLIEYSKFLQRIKAEGEGTLVWSKEDRPANSVRISAENNPRWAPLDGMYTTKEFLDALQHFERESILKLEAGGSLEQINAFGLMLNTLTKASLTKWNIPSNFRNHYGAMMMAARMGYANPVRFTKDVTAFLTGKEQSEQGMAKAYKDFYKGMSMKEKENFDREEFNTMRKLGLIDDSVGYQTYKDSIRLAMKTSGQVRSLINKLDKSTVGTIAKTPRKVMDKIYLAPDAAAKMYLFRNMKEDYGKAYPDLTEEQLNEKVANIIKDTMPTYSRMSKGAKVLSRNPIFGAFSSFTTETVRNYFNQISLTKDLAADYKAETDPEAKKALKKLVNRNVSGLIGMTLLVPTIATITKLAIGLSDEDDEALRSNAPEWERNSWKIYLGKGKDGSIIGVDLSYVDPLSVMTKPVFAFISGVQNEDEDMIDTSWEVIKEMGNQFAGEEPLFKAAWESATNEDAFGRPIARPLQGEEYKRLLHLADVIKPKFIDNFIGAKKAYIDEKTEEEAAFGKKYEPMTYTFSILGFGVRDRDILKSAKFNISGDMSGEGGVNDARNIYKYGERTQENLDKANAELAEIYNKHLLHIQGARVAGATDGQIREALNERSKSGRRYIPKYWADQLLREQFVPLRPQDFELKGRKKKTTKTKVSKKKKSSPFLK